MTVKATFLGHSAVLLDGGDHRVVVDPFLTDNPLASVKADEIDAQAIVLTHGHGDHIADAESIAKRCGATVFAPYELAEYMTERGVEHVEPMGPGGTVEAAFGSVTLVHAVHSSSFEGRYMGPACGAIVRIGARTVYHLGDTALFSDLKMIGERHNPHLAFVPIGDRFTMGPEDACVAAEWVEAKTVVPVHYKTFPGLVQSADHFRPAGIEVSVLEPGESVDV